MSFLLGSIFIGFGIVWGWLATRYFLWREWISVFAHVVFALVFFVAGIAICLTT